MTAPRLDVALVRRGLARSRNRAAAMIADRRVTVDGTVTLKSSARVSAADTVAVLPPADGPVGREWSSRGAHKLTGALDAFGVHVAGRRALDAGASTGGFTDVLLRRGAVAVAAVDVGMGQLDPALAADERVVVSDHTNIRDVAGPRRETILAGIGGPAQIIVADLSFISLTLVLPNLVACADTDADILPMVKPQFEVGRSRLGAHGVVRDPAARADAVTAVAEGAADLGWAAVAVTASPLPGPAGNVEYFLHLRSTPAADRHHTRDLVERAVREGPQ